MVAECSQLLGVSVRSIGVRGDWAFAVARCSASLHVRVHSVVASGAFLQSRCVRGPRWVASAVRQWVEPFGIRKAVVGNGQANR